MAFVEALPKTVKVKGKEYSELRFNGVIDKQLFKDYASTVLHGNACVYSDKIKKWFCPTDQVGWVIKQTDAFLGTPDDLGALIADEYDKP